ncbi:MAG: hypothetical protein U0931_14875 [Vulcanimicrobiota bacterium]
MKTYQYTALVLAAASSLLLPAFAARRKSDPGPHPLKVLKIVQDGSSTQNMNGTSGRYHVWMQNTTDLAVDKVEIQMELWSKTGRLEDTIKKDVGTVESGAKSMVELKYNVVGESSLKPRFWVLYNGGKEAPIQFEVDGPSWNY